MSALAIAASVSDRQNPWRRAARATWILHRGALVVIAAVSIAVLVGIVGGGIGVQGTYSHFLAERCVSAPGSGSCPRLAVAITGNNTAVSDLSIVLHVLPVLVGVFLGAPLVARELESGSFRFTWTQGLGRKGFELRRVGLLALATVALSVVLGLLLGWYAHPVEVVGAQSQWDAGLFNSTALVLPAWTLFAFAVGTLLGFLVGRSVGAMAATAAVVGGVVVAALTVLHDHLLQIAAIAAHPRTTGLEWGTLNRASLARQGPKGSWLVKAWITNPHGHVLGTTSIFTLMRHMPKSASADPPAWLTSLHYGYWISYQPADRFWMFQCIAAGVLVVLAIVVLFALSRLMGNRG